MKKMLTTLSLLSLLAMGQTQAAAPAAPAPARGEEVAVLDTNLGRVILRFFPKKAPGHVKNFKTLISKKYYDGIKFHRVIPGFMIQGGGFDAAMRKKPTRAPIENEAKNGLRNETGTLAMARTTDPHSASAQFFINLVDNRFLDYPSRDGWGYAVFGKVTEGFDVVQKIGRLPTRTANGMQNVPEQPVTIESVRVVDAVPAKSTKQ